MASKGPAGLLPKFRDITRTRLTKLVEALDAVHEGDRDEELVAGLLREIHTVKGESKMMGFEVMNLVAHHTEELLVVARAAGFTMSEQRRDEVLYGLDLLSALVLDEQPPARELEEAARAFLHGESGVAEAQTTPATQPSVPEAAAPAPVSAAAPPPPSAPAPSERGAADSPDVVRVDAATLGALTSLSGELERRQQHTERLLAELLRLTGEVSRGGSGPAPGADSARPSFRTEQPAGRRAAIGKEMAALVRRLQEGAFEAQLHIGELQETVRRMRMCPIDSLLNSYPAALRGMARELGKRLDVTVDAGMVIVDKQVVDQLGEPLVHLLRNSVDHGVEMPEERKAAGKPERGAIALSARQASGAQVEISIEDDGRGIDPAAVRAAAVARGVCTAAEADAMSDAEARWLLFRAGFSTRRETSLLSGRGVGLDVVKKAIEALGGTVSVESEQGRGTRFLLRVPVSVALTRALIVEAAAGLFALPSPSVLLATRVSASEVEAVGEGHLARIEGQRLRLLHLDELLGQPPPGSSPLLDVVVLEDSGQRVALSVRRLIGEHQLVRKGLDGFLSGMPLINGTAVLEGGRHCFFLNQAALFRSDGRSDARATATGPSRRARVLIVDDSEITRDMLVSSLRRLDCDVIEAVDGQDALERIEAGPVDLVLSDLDMPVLDGFALIRALRSRADTQHVPIVVLSTRGSSEDKTRAMGAGANAYVVKSRFKQTDLHGLLRAHLPRT